jgi:hypothetical protein
MGNWNGGRGRGSGLRAGVGCLDAYAWLETGMNLDARNSNDVYFCMGCRAREREVVSLYGEGDNATMAFASGGA